MSVVLTDFIKKRRSKRKKNNIELDARLVNLKEQDAQDELPWLLSARVYSAAEKGLAVFVKDASAKDWIMRNKIDPIIQDMPKKRLEDALAEYKDFGRINNLGPHKLNREAIKKWQTEYSALAEAQVKKEQEEKALKLQEAAEREKLQKATQEKIEERNRQKRREQKQRWNQYKEDFRRLNLPQQKHELAWFKKMKYMDFTDSQTEKEIYAHELEMIILGGIR